MGSFVNNSISSNLENLFLLWVVFVNIIIIFIYGDYSFSQVNLTRFCPTFWGAKTPSHPELNYYTKNCYIVILLNKLRNYFKYVFSI